VNDYMKDLAYAALMQARRPKCPTCGELASMGGAFGSSVDGVESVKGYAFSCPNGHNWKTGPDYLPRELVEPLL